MQATIHIEDKTYQIDLNSPLDISLPLRDAIDNPEAWYLKKPAIEPVELDGWTAKVSEGASVNFNNIAFNPHAHGTHTECVGHISSEFHSVNDALKTFFFTSEVISVTPEVQGEDHVISEEIIKRLLNGKTPEAVVIRTLPNSEEKRTKQYSHTNWPYLQEAAARYLHNLGVKHLLIDLPSVDREKDDGKLLAHKAFWNYPKATRHEATITEFIFVPTAVTDGSYLLNLQIAPFHNDATPSKPVLYKLIQ